MGGKNIRAPLVEMRKRVLRAHDAVLVKAEAPVGAAEPRATPAVQLALARLCRDTGGRVERVMINEPFDDLRRRDTVGAIQGHAESLPRGEALEDVHVVGEGDPLIWPAEDMIVPGRPRAPRARQQR